MDNGFARDLPRVGPCVRLPAGGHDATPLPRPAPRPGETPRTLATTHTPAPPARTRPQSPTPGRHIRPERRSPDSPARLETSRERSDTFLDSDHDVSPFRVVIRIREGSGGSAPGPSFPYSPSLFGGPALEAASAGQLPQPRCTEPLVARRPRSPLAPGQRRRRDQNSGEVSPPPDRVTANGGNSNAGQHAWRRSQRARHRAANPGGRAVLSRGPVGDPPGSGPAGGLGCGAGWFGRGCVIPTALGFGPARLCSR